MTIKIRNPFNICKWRLTISVFRQESSMFCLQRIRGVQKEAASSSHSDLYSFNIYFTVSLALYTFLL